MAALLAGELAGVHDPRGIGREGERLRRALPGATVVEAGALAMACAEPARAAGVLAGMAGRIQRPGALREHLGLGPDTAVADALAAGYRRWEQRLLEHIRGPFALVLWDEAARRGLLAQDQLGGRSLFTFHDGPRLCFATEIGVLLALLRRRPDPDELALAHHLVEHSVPDGRMLYQGIRRLGGGCLLGLSDAGRAERRYWTPRYRPPLQAPRAELAARLRDELEAAVQDALPEDSRGALLLSGGLDSSVVAALAAPRAPDLQAIAAAFAEPEFDETPWARRVADDTGLALTTVAIEAARAARRRRGISARLGAAAAHAGHPDRGAADRRGGPARSRGRARRPGRRRALRRRALPHRRPRAAPATAVGLAAFAPAPVAGRRPAAASRPARVHERRRPRGARADAPRAGPPATARGALHPRVAASRPRRAVSRQPGPVALEAPRRAALVGLSGRRPDARTRDRRPRRLPAPARRHGRRSRRARRCWSWGWSNWRCACRPRRTSTRSPRGRWCARPCTAR